LRRANAALALAAALLLMTTVGCQGTPTKNYAKGELLLADNFTESDSWENYSDAAQHVDFHVENGVYHAQASDGGFMWTLGGDSYTDTILEVQTRQLSTGNNNSYGVMCRASPENNSDGYFFFISGDGQYTVRRGSNREVNALIPWTGSSAIHTGQSINVLRAICIGDYLALYVNDTFVAETHDSLYHQGYAGLTAAVPKSGTVDVNFANLSIWAGMLIGAPSS
jgi:hypothetical protein